MKKRPVKKEEKKRVVTKTPKEVELYRFTSKAEKVHIHEM